MNAGLVEKISMSLILLTFAVLKNNENMHKEDQQINGIRSLDIFECMTVHFTTACANGRSKNERDQGESRRYMT
jgi:hypothetical protein